MQKKKKFYQFSFEKSQRSLILKSFYEIKAKKRIVLKEKGMELDRENMPKHIAIIMDGNRRWAKENHLDYRKGHEQGAKTLEKIVRDAKDLGIQYITVYAFSTENWKRTEEEVGALMMLLQKYLDDYSKRADTENIKIQYLGNLTVLSKKMQKSIQDSIERTKNNTGIYFNIALNYGGRDELTYCMRQIAQEVLNHELTVEQITEETIANHLYTKGMPDPDLLIRTSGEMRLSNFLPWQLVYTEFLFVDKNWPDFTKQDLIDAILHYQSRNRKFGAQ